MNVNVSMDHETRQAWHNDINNTIYKMSKLRFGYICIAAVYKWLPCVINTSRPRQIAAIFSDAIFKCIFLNENVWISHKISMKFVPKVRIKGAMRFGSFF